MLGNFVGKISRADFSNIFDGRDLVGIPVGKIEAEMIQFYTLLFSGRLDSELDKIRELMIAEF